MSDLDDFFARRLDEEPSFKHRDKSWSQISKRLDAYDAGVSNGGSSALKLWRLTAIAGIGALMVLGWQHAVLHRENRQLQRHMEGRQQEMAFLKESPAPVARSQQEQASVSAQQKPDAGQMRSAQLQQNIIKQSPETPDFASFLPAKAHKNSPASKDTPVSPLPNEVPVSTNIVANEAPLLPHAAALPLFADTVAQALLAAQLETLQQENKALQALVDSLSAAQALPKTESPQEKIAEAENVPAAPVPAKPVQRKNSRLQIGTRGVAGFATPRQKGISALKGQGFNVQARILPSLWATASIDWVQHRIVTQTFHERFHPHHDSLPKPPFSPGGGGGGNMHETKLVSVETNPRYTQLNLGLQYDLPLRFWVRPAVRLSHMWTLMAPTQITYGFMEEDHGGPGGPGHPEEKKYTSENFDKQWIDNQWSAGLGLQKDLGRWNLALWADYVKDFSNKTPSFDALYLRGGASYSF